jgi:hypothetical protein
MTNQLLITHKLTAALIECFDEEYEDTQEDMCEFVKNLSIDMINLISEKINQLDFVNRVNIAKIIDKIRCNSKIFKTENDVSILDNMVDILACHIENEEGWNS